MTLNQRRWTMIAGALLLGCGGGASPSAGADAMVAAMDADSATDAALLADVNRDAVTVHDAHAGVDVSAGTDLGTMNDVGAPNDVGVLDDVAAMADASDVGMVVGAYPPGPYGNAVGDVVPNLAWVGYVDPTGTVPTISEPYGPTSMGALRGTGHGYALLHVSEFY